MRLSLSATAAALLALASSSLVSVAAQSYTYTFASAGVNGTIKVQYLNATSSNATITADLDFSNVTLTDLTAIESACTAAPTEYAWHIHVQWPTTSNTTTASYAQCAKSVVGNHYDPLKACGPASEYVGTTNCTTEKTSAYACTAATYATNASACEKGDLSGKLGKLTVGSNKKANGTWTDANYPLLAENTAQWNMVLHAVCGTATPRVACALGKFTAAAAAATSTNGTATNSTTTNGTTTPTPTPSTTSAAAVHRSTGALNGVVVVTSLLALLATAL